MNRSPDPISNIQITFRVPFSGAVLLSDTPEHYMVQFAVSMPSVPPCSDVVLTPSNMKYQLGSGKIKGAAWFTPFRDLPTESGWQTFEKDMQIEEGVADFNDRDGDRWRRSRGLLTLSPRKLNPKAEHWGVVHSESPQPLKFCGGERSGLYP